MAVCNIKSTYALGQLLVQCKIIVWNNCTIVHKKSIDVIYKTLQEFSKQKGLMGGILLLLLGDVARNSKFNTS